MGAHAFPRVERPLVRWLHRGPSRRQLQFRVRTAREAERRWSGRPRSHSDLRPAIAQQALGAPSGHPEGCAAIPLARLARCTDALLRQRTEVLYS